MRVHSVSITAFGPFADTVNVDLDALSGDGLFLLCGPTGAGKTSLLDAIAFALYGRVPGARGEEKRLRSDHAIPTVRTEVVCELTLRGERVRITRRPEQERPKSRGDGTTKDQALLHVQRRVAECWQPVSTRLDEGGDYLRAQIGLTPEQFWQVVLLPQGEFAEFLRAEPDQRAKVLETLFDARRFAEVETWLAEQARSRAASLAAGEEVVDRLVHRVEQAARGLPPRACAVPLPAMPASGSPDAVRAHVAGQMQRATGQLAVARRADEVTRRRLDLAEGGRQRGRCTVRALARLLAACRNRDSCTAGSEELAQERAVLERAVVAEPLRPLLEVDSVASANMSRTAADLRESYAELTALAPGSDCPVRLRPRDEESGQLELVAQSGDDCARVELRRWSRILRDEVVRLGDLDSESRDLAGWELRLAELTAALADRRVRLVELDDVSRELPAALAALEMRLDAARVAAAGASHAAQELTATQARVAAGTRARELAGLISAADAEHATCERAALAAKADWLSLREVRLAGIAAELAAQLADGQDCPVCGSLDHPSPAKPAVTAVTAADEQSAVESCERLDEASRQSGARTIELRAALDVCRSITAGSSLSVLGRELAAARNADLTARAAAEQLPVLVAEHVAILAGRSELGEHTSQLTVAQAEDRAAAKELTGRVRSGLLRLDKARGKDASLAVRRKRLAALAEAAEAAEQIWAAHQEAATAAARSRTRLDERMRRSDFAGTAAARAALLDDESRERLSNSIRDHEDVLTTARSELIAAAEDLQSALAEMVHSSTALEFGSGEARTQDVEDLSIRIGEIRSALDQEHTSATQARDAAVAELSQALGIQDQLVELRVLLEQAVAECGPLRAASTLAGELATLAAGGGANVKKMRLRSYVLAARLEQVAAAATERLRQMSSGRYGFVHTDDLRGGNRRSGLSLDILDSHTGTQRPTKTLSGGESFMAALALALGLADVVTAESGGICLDTLFVDEGFGSLDPESLDAVMTVLDELRQGGRVVGIVSHVEELRTRVPMQLQIKSSSHGSTLDPPGGLDEETSSQLAG